MSISNVSLPVFNYPNITSDLNAAEKVKVKKTSDAVKEIALTIIFGILAVTGAVLIGVGTAATFGTLPLFLIASGTFFSTVLASVAGTCAVRKTNGYECSECWKNEYKTANGFIGDFAKKKSIESTNNVHPHFARDCARDCSAISVNGQTFDKQFPKRYLRILELEQTLSALQKTPKETIGPFFNAQLVAVAKDLEFCRAKLEEEIMDSLTKVVKEKLGGDSPLLAPISLALCQDIRLSLDKKTQEIACKKFNGIFYFQDDIGSKISYLSALEFPTEGDVVAKITVKGSGQYNTILVDGTRKQLETPCNYEGEAIISIDRSGKTSIENSVVLKT